MIVFILNGAAESGKDSFVGIVKDSFDVSLRTYSSITWAKEIARTCFEWDGEKDKKSRSLLTDIKQLGIKYNNIPFNNVTTKIQSSKFVVDLFVVDVREPLEIIKLVQYCDKEYLPCITILIKNETKEKAAKDLSKIGDNSYAEYYYDQILKNNGSLSEFEKTVKDSFINYLFKRKAETN